MSSVGCVTGRSWTQMHHLGNRYDSKYQFKCHHSQKYRKTRLYTGQGLRISVDCGNTEKGNTTTRDDMTKDNSINTINSNYEWNKGGSEN